MQLSCLQSCLPSALQNTDKREVAWMFWILLLLLVVSRAAFVLPVTFAHNRFSDNKLTMREMGTIWWAGLMRGAVSGGHSRRAPGYPLGCGELAVLSEQHAAFGSTAKRHSRDVSFWR